MHEAGTVRSCHIFGTSLHVALHLVLTHLGTDGRLFYGEHTTETAAFIRALGFNNLDAVN